MNKTEDDKTTKRREKDQNLLRRVQNKDPQAQRELIERFDTYITRFFHQRVGPIDYRDLRQDFYQLVMEINPETIQYSVPAYLWGIARNQVRKYYRETKSSPIPLKTSQALRESTLSRKLAREVDVFRLDEALRALEPRDQDILYFRYTVGLKYREMEEIFETTEEALRVRTFVIRGRLREMMEEQVKGES